MHQFVAIYGLAAHLTLVSMAPLFLFPFVAGSTLAYSLLALSPLALLWMLMEPFAYPGEMLHDARKRVLYRLIYDPLVWILLLLVVGAFVANANNGVAYVYDIEQAEWKAALPKFSFLPGSVASTMLFPAAQLVVLMLVVLSVRHACGQQSTLSLLLLLTFFTGLAAVLWFFLGFDATGVGRSNGSICGFALVLSSVAAFLAFDQRVAYALPFLSVAVAGNLIGLVVFSSPLILLVMLSVWLILSILTIIRLRGKSVFYGGVGFPLVLVASLIVAFVILSTDANAILTAQIEAVTSMKLFDETYFKYHAILSDCAKTAWLSSPWLGSGFGSFEIDMRLFLDAKSWEVLPTGTIPPFNGWWKFLAENGIVGAALLALPLGYLVIEFGRFAARLVRTPRVFADPLVLAGPIALLVFVALPFCGQNALTVEALMVTFVLLAVSVRTLRTLIRGEENNG